MHALGFCLEMLGIYWLFSAFSHARRRDWIENHGTSKGKQYAAKMRWFAVGIRAFFAIVFFLVGLWLVGR